MCLLGAKGKGLPEHFDDQAFKAKCHGIVGIVPGERAAEGCQQHAKLSGENYAFVDCIISHILGHRQIFKLLDGPRSRKYLHVRDSVSIRCHGMSQIAGTVAMSRMEGSPAATVLARLLSYLHAGMT